MKPRLVTEYVRLNHLARAVALARGNIDETSPGAQYVSMHMHHQSNHFTSRISQHFSFATTQTLCNKYHNIKFNTTNIRQSNYKYRNESKRQFRK